MANSEAAFREELQGWLKTAHRPLGLRDFGATPPLEDVEPARAWQRTLQLAAWAGLSWPADFGGRGPTVAKPAAFAE